MFNPPILFDTLQRGLDLASSMTVIAGTIGLVLAFWALARGA